MENVSGLVLSPAKGEKLLIDLCFKPLSPLSSACSSKPPKCLAPRKGIFGTWANLGEIQGCFYLLQANVIGLLLVSLCCSQVGSWRNRRKLNMYIHLRSTWVFPSDATSDSFPTSPPSPLLQNLFLASKISSSWYVLLLF